MRLKYQYKLNTWARDERYDSQNSLTQIIDNYKVEFAFNDNHNVTGIHIFIPNVRMMLNGSGSINASLDKGKNTEAHSIANYIANMLYEQTGKCDFTKEGSFYVPETEEDRKELEGKMYARSISLEVAIRGHANLSRPALSRYINPPVMWDAYKQGILFTRKYFFRIYKNDLADLFRHVSIEKRSGFWSQVRIAPRNPEVFYNILQDAIEKRVAGRN